MNQSSVVANKAPSLETHDESKVVGAKVWTSQLQSHPHALVRPLVAILLAVLALLVASFGLDVSITVAALLGLLAAGGCVVLLGRFHRVGSLPMMYALVFSLFHFGTAPELIVGSEEMLRGNRFGFLASNSAPEAFIYAAYGLLIFTGFSMLFKFRPSAPTERSERVSQVGRSIMILSLVGYFAILTAALGPAWILRPYSDYTIIREDLPVGWPVFGLGLGVVLASTTRSRRHFRATMAVFFPAGAMLAFFGLRGEVLFPAACVVGMRVYLLELELKWRQVGASLLIGLAITSAISALRVNGLSAEALAEVSPSALDGLSELGYTIRPSVEVLDWRSEGGDPLGGSTYIDAVTNVARRVVSFGRSRTEASAATAIIQRNRPAGAAGLGSSPIAEGLVNGSTLVVAFAMASTAGALHWAASSRSDLAPALIAVTAFPFFVQIRNGFSPVPLQVAVGVGLVIMIAHSPKFLPAFRTGAAAAPGSGPDWAVEGDP